ncbi:hypothetical protein CU098_009393 [Rhizopus stolonifer]|uniref:Fungal lipase-type domain-containing protein n=1 Tax=Rhizopus stolonifer TaxID=4846 RepID=A0A367KL97_RHIST|nr:hypothetical protein CU098_009393 [Rhizopus stolonifer]
MYAKEGIAVTLTTKLSKDHQGPISLLQSKTLCFLTSQTMLHSSFDHKVYVHYEPKKSHVVLGTNPEARHSKAFKLTVQQFAWIIQQLNEEQVVYDSLERILSPSSSDLLLYFQSPLLGVSGVTNHSRSLGKKLLGFVQRKRNTQDILYPQCLFMLPKALLIQAAGHVPLPTRSSLISDSTHLLFDTPYELITTSYLNRLKRYCRYLAHCSHELVLSTLPPIPSLPNLHSPPASTNSKKGRAQMHSIQCTDCPLQCGLETLQAETTHHPLSFHNTHSIQFPISYNHYMTQLNTADLMMTSALEVPNPNTVLDSENKRPQAISAFQYIPPEKSSDDVSSLGSLENTVPFEKYGYVAVDHEAEDILVVFPGMTLSQTMMDHVSFKATPWVDSDRLHEKRERTSQEMSETEDPWVLECALTAWHRCEIKVVTLLMRLCATVPSRYRVVIIGHSLGGAVACLCASSLRNTRLLLNRPITVCTIFSPRIANRAFLQTLSTQDVNVIRITNQTGLMAHLPPRTCGLLHAGDSTVILSPCVEDAYVLENMLPELVEDTLNKTCISQEAIETQSDSHIWGIELDNDRLKCITNLL